MEEDDDQISVVCKAGLIIPQHYGKEAWTCNAAASSTPSVQPVGKIVSANRLRLLRLISVELFVIMNCGCRRLVSPQHDQERLPQITQSGQLFYVHHQVVLLASCYSFSESLNNATECGVMWQISFWVLS